MPKPLIADIVQHSGIITDFQRRVYLELLKVPRGQTISYKVLGARIGCGSAQAIGQALKRNPYAVGCQAEGVEFTLDYCVPCHRVIASDGSLCGFNGQREGAQLDRKHQLLMAEQHRDQNE